MNSFHENQRLIDAINQENKGEVLSLIQKRSFDLNTIVSDLIGNSIYQYLQRSKHIKISNIARMLIENGARCKTKKNQEWILDRMISENNIEDLTFLLESPHLLKWLVCYTHPCVVTVTHISFRIS